MEPDNAPAQDGAAHTLLSVIVPVHNEAQVLETFHQRLLAATAEVGMQLELLYVDDGSSDDSLVRLLALRKADPRVLVIELSRRFGKEVAVSAGLDHARGAAVAVIDADLQDPPELLPAFVAAWREGYDVVYGQRLSRHGESWLKSHLASGFYRILNRLSDVPIPRDAGDFRLLSRRAVDAVISLRESHRYMAGLFSWVGFPSKAIPYHREARHAGRSKWSYLRLWRLALEGITSFSTVPLKLATFLGVFTASASLLYGLYFLLRTLFLGNPVPGYPSLIVVMLFLGGVQLTCLGIIGEYLGRIYGETKRRPLYFIRHLHAGDD